VRTSEWRDPDGADERDELRSRLCGALPTVREHRARVDRDGVFPSESVQALRSAGLLSAPCAPGSSMPSAELMTLAIREISGTCGSTGLVLTMHLSILCSLLEVVDASSPVEALLRGDRERGAPLIAGITSEVGATSIRESVAACETTATGTIRVRKRTHTASYVEHADLVVITARRTPSALPTEQVLVVATREDIEVRAEGEWDALGMRGTETIPAEVVCEVPPEQVIDRSFSELLSRSVGPYIQLAWAACWEGIAQDAAAVATEFVRAHASTFSPDLAALRSVRLGDLHRKLGTVAALTSEFERELDRTRTRRLAAPWPFGFADLTRRSTELRLTVSQLAVEVALEALEVIGVAGYLSEDRTPYAVGRQIRDLLSARVMVHPDGLRLSAGELAFVPR